MRHKKRERKLGRTWEHRKALLKNLAKSLVEEERIQTTQAKAKELRKLADRMVTLAKRQDLHARRQTLAVINEKDVVHKLFKDVSEEKFGSRQSGYTRIVKLGPRKGDAAPMTMVELLEE